MRYEHQNSPDTTCPHCGTDAHWSFLDTAEKRVEVACPNCGRFEMPVGEFEQNEFDIAQPEEQHT